MPQKKGSEIPLSETEQRQVQQLLEQYQALSATLRTTTSQPQALAALSALIALPEQVQLALLQALTRAQTPEAADLVVALNTFSTFKEIRKEARRALIRLETAKVSALWNPPIDTTSAVQVNVLNAPRFWKGQVSLSRDQGEIELFLHFEQGYDYTEVHSFIFQLDFWKDGIKDVIVDVANKRHTQENVERMRAKMPALAFSDCTLAEAKRLLEEALSINLWQHTAPHENFRRHAADIKKLILQQPDPGPDRGLTFINPELEEKEFPLFFIGGWSLGDYALTYDLLAAGNSLRETFTRDEWITLHRAWADEAHPARMQLGFVHERPQAQSALWLPSSPRSTFNTTRKEIEVGWSLDLTETPLSGTLKEMPLGTAVNKETGRHWFWTIYTLVRENGAWRIQHITDEGAAIQALPITELQRRVKESEDAINVLIEQQASEEAMDELSWRITQLLHYDDAIIARLPFDREVCTRATSHAISSANPERAMVYLERLTTRFPDHHAELLRQLGATTMLVVSNYAYDHPELKERNQQLMARAEGFMREALMTDNSVIGHLLLSELLMNQERNDEAETEVLRAKELKPSNSEEATLESILGAISMRREQFENAAQHFQRVVDIEPERPGIWFNLGFARRLLGQLDQAEALYSEAIRRAPEDIRSYSELIALHMNQEHKLQARAIAEQGSRAMPDSAEMHSLFASVLHALGEERYAQREQDEAEKINPHSDFVVSVRQQLTKRQ